jgi:hypothetical protein
MGHSRFDRSLPGAFYPSTISSPSSTYLSLPPIDRFRLRLHHLRRAFGLLPHVLLFFHKAADPFSGLSQAENLQAFFTAVTNCRHVISIPYLIAAQLVIFLRTSSRSS